MKIKLPLFILILGAVVALPAQAMLVGRFSSLATQTSLLTRTSRMTPSLGFELPHNPTLLARTLATQGSGDYSGHRYSYRGNNQSDESNHEQSGSHNWWQRFRSRFARSEHAPMFGISLFGYHILWTDSDICQTAEDFKDTERLNLTKDYYKANGPQNIFRVFVKNFETLKNDPTARERILEYLAQTLSKVKDNPKLIDAVEQLAINNLALLENNTWGKQLLNEMLTHCPLFTAKLALCGKKEQSSTQSVKHFTALQSVNLEKFRPAFPENPEAIQAFIQMIRKVLESEETEEKNGNYTFIHAYPWHIRFLQDLDAQLRTITFDLPEMPLSLRFIKLPSEDTLVKSFTMRSSLVHNGTARHYTREKKAQKHMIFLNHSLFANERRANAMAYISKNYGGYPPQILLNKIFSNLGLEEYLEKYKTDIEALQELHRDASSYGAGLLFSFTPEMLQESVYVCSRGGKKRTVLIDGIGETDNVKVIIDTLRTAPEKIHDLDTLEFVFVVTKDCGLNPIAFKKGHAKWIPFNAADAKKLALYEQKRDELIDKIKTDIATERAQWSAEETNRFLTQQQDIAQWFEKNFCLNRCGSDSRLQEAESVSMQESISPAQRSSGYWMRPKNIHSHGRIGSLLRSSSSKADPKRLISSIKNEYPHLKKLFGMPASQGANHSLEEHTAQVLQQLHSQMRYYNVHDACYQHITDKLERLLTAVILVHDIGKPLGHRTEQHTFTMPIARQALKDWGFSDNECALAIALIDHDMLGELAQEDAFNITPEQVYADLQKLADEVGLSLKDFFRLQMLFFVSDATSYRHIRYRAFVENSVTKQLIPTSKRLGKLIQMIDPNIFKAY